MSGVFHWESTKIWLLCYPAIVSTQQLGEVWRHTPGVTKCPDKRGRSLRITSLPCNLDPRWYNRKISSDISSQGCFLILLRVSQFFHFSCHMTFKMVSCVLWENNKMYRHLILFHQCERTKTKLDHIARINYLWNYLLLQTLSLISGRE